MTWLKFMVTLVWPFVREMILGGKTIMEAFKENKKRVIFAFIVMGSFISNAALIGRIIAISREHVVLQQKYETAIAGSKQNPIHNGVEVGSKEPKPRPPPVLPVVEVEPEKHEEKQEEPVPKVVSKGKPRQKVTDERFEHLKRTFESIREREQKEEEAQRTQ